MPFQVKSLLVISQDILTNNIDGLTYVGNVPYSLLKPSLKKATPQQLYLIERLNPHLLPESDELWLRHMSIFKDLLDAYHQGDHQDSTTWRGLYLKRYRENEERKKIISEKVKSQYNKIQHEKKARSIKMIKGEVRGRTYENRKSSTSNNSSKLFQDTKKAASKTAAIYRCQVQQSYRHHTSPSYMSNTINQDRDTPSNDNVFNVSKPPSKLARAYQANQSRYGLSTPLQSKSTSPLIAPQSSIQIPSSLSKSHSSSTNHRGTAKLKDSERLKRQKISLSQTKSRKLSHQSSTPSDIQAKKPVALVNYSLFQELG